MSSAPERAAPLRRRLRLWTWIFIVGLLLSGLTALPIQTQFDLAERWFGADFRAGGASISKDAPFAWYGTDWLAFIGALPLVLCRRWVVELESH